VNAVVAAHLQIMVRRLMSELQEEPFRFCRITRSFRLFGAIPE
jgi:hypothetical protein